MNSNQALKNLSNSLLNGNYSDLAKQATKDLTSSEIKPEFLATNCMSTKLAFDMDMTNLAHRLEAKSNSGMNTAKTANYDRYVKTFKTNGLFKKHDIVEDIIKFLKNNDCNISKKEEIASSIEHLSKDSQNKNVSAIAPIFAYIITKKFDENTKDSSQVIETEKELEPLVISLINNGKVKSDLTTRTLKEEVRTLIKDACQNEDKSKKVDLFFHDMAVSAYINTIINKPEFVRMGIEKDSAMPLTRVDDKGIPKTYFEHNHSDQIKRTKFLVNKKIIDFKDIDQSNVDYKSYIYTTLKLLQHRAGVEVDLGTGASKSRVANPNTAARVLIEFAILCDKLNANIDNDLAFAIANPLIDLVSEMERKTIEQIVDAAGDDVLDILKNANVTEKTTTQKEKPEEKKEETKPETTSTEEKENNPIETTKKSSSKPTGNAKNPNKLYRIGVWEASAKILTSILFNGRLGDKVLTFNQKEYLRQLKTDLDYFKDLEIIKNPVEKNQPRNFNKAAKDKNMSDGVKSFLQTIMNLETEETLKVKIAELATQTADTLVKETINNYIELTKEEIVVIEKTVPTSEGEAE